MSDLCNPSFSTLNRYLTYIVLKEFVIENIQVHPKFWFNVSLRLLIGSYSVIFLCSSMNMWWNEQHNLISSMRFKAVLNLPSKDWKANNKLSFLFHCKKMSSCQSLNNLTYTCQQHIYLLVWSIQNLRECKLCNNVTWTQVCPHKNGFLKQLLYVPFSVLLLLINLMNHFAEWHEWVKLRPCKHIHI